jgi:Flp pilus assembly protein TadD
MPTGRRSRLLSRRRAAAILLVAAIAGTPTLSCHAVEGDADLPAAMADPDYAAGKQAFDRRDWHEAVRRFSQAALRDPDNADLHNYLGYSHRQVGQLDAAFKHYGRALALNPRHRGAHEYMGEAYLMVNDLAKAEEHVAALERLCLLPCEELNDLRRAVAAYKGRVR